LAGKLVTRDFLEVLKMANITYTQVGDYLLPDLVVGDEAQPVYGKYGMLCKRYFEK
jgi:hypothetical protein